MYRQLKEKIIAKSQEIGIDKIGFTTAEPFEDLRIGLEEQKNKEYSSGFEHPDIEERIYLEKIFSEPRSIISIALAYPSRLRERPEKIKGEKRGQFARASWGTDYHFILLDKLKELIAYIQSEIQNESFEFKPMVDTGELVDVAVAQRAGLGFVGRNGLLITEEFGSYVYLGEVITNIPFEPDQPMENQCGECTRCLDLCPTSALLGEGRMNAKRCLSYQTQTKGMMPIEFRPKIRNIIYGCDICQEVCPFNKGKDFHFHDEMEPDPELVKPLLKPMLTISNREFKEKFGKLAGSWRGKKPLQRNAIIALANQRDQSAIPHLLACIENDVRPVIQATAIWAIGEIDSKGNPELKQFIPEIIEKTNSDEVREECFLVLEKWNENS